MSLSRRLLLGRSAVAICWPTAAMASDPIFAAIEGLRRSEAELTSALSDLDETNPEQLRRADEAADLCADARNALSRVLPTTPAGFRALVRFHAEDVAFMEPDTFGALALRDIARAMEALLRTRAPPD